MFDDLDIFSYKEVEIFYQLDNSNKNYFHKFEPFEKNDQICFIELIQNTSEEYGKGEATKAINLFLEHMINKGIKNFYLFSSYDESYYKENEGLIGLNRLVSFYERFGFEPLSSPSSAGDQIDMYLEIEK